MTSTTFVDKQTVIQAAWLNDVNTKTYADSSDTVAYTPAGTGAVATTVQTKLRESVSVKDFGAVGDGITDDTVAVQAAVTAHLNVYFPAGDFLIDADHIVLREGSCLHGAGIGVTRIIAPRTTGASTGVFYANSGAAGTQLSGITIRDIEFDGQVSTLGFLESRHLVSLNGVKDALIERCQFTGFRGDGIYLGSGIVGGDERHNTNVTIQNCVFDGVNSDNRNGITVIDCDGVHILNNTFRNCTKSTMPGPIDIEPNADLFHVIRNINIVDNSIESFGGAYGIAVYLDSGPYTSKLFGVAIRDNYIAGGSKTNPIAIRVSTAETISTSTIPMGIEISGNAINDTLATGMSPFILYYARGVSVKDNVFSSGTSAELGKQTVADLTVMDAVIRGNQFYKNGNNSSGALGVASVNNLIIEGNIVDSPNAGVSTIGIRFVGNGVTTVSDNVKVLNNTFIKGASQTFSFNVSSHTLTTANNSDYGTRVIGGSLTNSFTANYGGSDLSYAGTYTPAIQGSTSAGAGTYSVQQGSYQVIGKLCFFKIGLTWSAHTGTGNIRFTLPFTAKAGGNLNDAGVLAYATNMTWTAGSLLMFSIGQNSAFGEVYAVASAGAAAAVALDTSASLFLTGTYELP